MLISLFFLPLLGVWVFHELHYRQQAGLRPATLKELFYFSQNKTTPDRRKAALIFTLLVMFGFALWESVVAFLFSRPPWLSFSTLGFVVYLYALYQRQQSFAVGGRLKSRDIYLLILFAGLFLQSFFVLILSPWVIWRLRRAYP